MSLSSIKKKETKGKKNVLPKLINVLDDPRKRHWPLLKSNELKEFIELLERFIAASKLERLENVKPKSIHLGLESSLRVINQRQAACVFISLSLKPHFLIGLVARNVEAKDATVPVYVQPKLEDYTNRLFGIRSLILVITKNIGNISMELEQWVTSRKRQPPPVTKPKQKTTNLKRKFVKTTEEIAEAITTIPLSTIPAEPKQKRKCTGDFISLQQDDDAVVEYKRDTKKADRILADTLNSLAEKAKEKSPQSVNDKMDVDLEINEEKPQIEHTTEELNREDAEDVDYDDFLEDEYKPVSVSYIAPNPNKNKKKKKNKNKNKK